MRINRRPLQQTPLKSLARERQIASSLPSMGQYSMQKTLQPLALGRLDRTEQAYTLKMYLALQHHLTYKVLTLTTQQVMFVRTYRLRGSETWALAKRGRRPSEYSRQLSQAKHKMPPQRDRRLFMGTAEKGAPTTEQIYVVPQKGAASVSAGQYMTLKKFKKTTIKSVKIWRKNNFKTYHLL